MRRYIVFVSKDHYNPLGIVRTLGEAGITPTVVVVKSKPQLVTKSKYVGEKYIVSNPKEGIDLIISKFGNEEERPFILTGDDVTVSILDDYYDRLKDHFYFFNAGEAGRVKEFMNKDIICSLAEKHGFNVPKTWKVKNGEVPEDLEYPIFTKAVNSFGEEWKSIVFVCNNAQELKEAYSKIKSDEIIIQKYIEKIDEQGCEGFSVNHGRDVFFSVWNREAYHLPQQYAPVWFNSNPDNQDFMDKASAMLREIGFEGIFEFEFMLGKDNQLYFLEINFRNTVNGWETTCAGMPGVTLWCESMLQNRIVDNCYREIPDGFYTMAECFDYDVRVKEKILTRRQWAKEYKNANAKLYRGRNDFRPFFSFMWYKFWHMKKK